MKKYISQSYEEKLISELKEIYNSYGYSKYKMLKFEEYDLYVKNKDFLVSDNIVTFTNSSGKLMALKPDVTLSIVKNYRENTGEVQKVYYDENVYRSKPFMGLGEIRQTGLECIGIVDKYTMMEVLMLAAESLKTVNENYALDVSNLAILSAIFTKLEVNENVKPKVMKCIGEKSPHSFDVLKNNGEITEKAAEVLKNLIDIAKTEKEVKELLNEVLTDEEDKKTVEDFYDVVENVSQILGTDRIKVDFSVVNNLKYYNGIVFSGFIKGIPTVVVSGGQYDNLMKNMKKNASAIGFAVYADVLDVNKKEETKYDFDILLTYSDDADSEMLLKMAKNYTDEGKSVRVQKVKPSKLKFRKTVYLNGTEVEVLENND